MCLRLLNPFGNSLNSDQDSKLTKSPPKSLAGAALKMYPISSGLMTRKYSSSLTPRPRVSQKP